MTTGRSSFRHAEAFRRARFTALTALCSLVATPLVAHRLDEYLQTAQVTVEAGRIAVDVYLSPGTEVAGAVIGAIDTSRNGSISTDEQREYAAAVVSRISIRLDDEALPLTLQSFEYPALLDLVAGTGSIHVSAVAATGAITPGTHVVAFENGFRPPASIYMANAMLPKAAVIEILDQDRNGRQDQLDIRFRVNRVSVFATFGWAALWSVGVLVAVLLIIRAIRRFDTGVVAPGQ